MGDLALKLQPSLRRVVAAPCAAVEVVIGAVACLQLAAAGERLLERLLVRLTWTMALVGDLATLHTTTELANRD